MCKCLCAMRCNCDTEQNILDLYTKELQDSKNNRRITEEYVSRNIPMILDLVRRYNEVLKNRPETAKDAREQQELNNDLAKQIVAYTRL